MRCLEMTNKHAFEVVNFFTAVVSLSTCLYLLPLIPSVMSSLDEGLVALKTLNEELEASKRKLMTFMAFLCHEIRNPLFVITSNISFLEDEQDEQTVEYNQALQAISQSVDLMLRLVNDVLDISKLESGKLELQEHEFDLRETLEGVIRSTQRFVSQKHGHSVHLRTRIARNVPRLVYADSVRLLQIVFNLLSNANKFTENGYIDFSVSLVEPKEALDLDLITLETVDSSRSASTATEEDDAEGVGSSVGDFSLRLLEAAEHGQAGEDHGTPHFTLKDQILLRLRVEDTGDGIPPEQMARLFQPYAQSKLSTYRKHGGTGLGLAIVSKLTRAMGGKVLAKSDVGKGSVFEAIVMVNRVSDILPENTLNTNPIAVKRENQPHIEMRAKPHKTIMTPTREIQRESLIELPSPAPVASASMVSPTPSLCPPTRTKSECKTKHKFVDGMPHVLVVDDNDMNRKLLKRMLTQMNLPHLEAADGKQAVDVMLTTQNRSGDPNAPQVGIILMDLSMPVMDGFEATETIRSYPDFADLPIIALTAAAVEEGRSKCEKVGMTEYQTKPIKRDQLYAVCKRHLLPISQDEDSRPNIEDLLV